MESTSDGMTLGLVIVWLAALAVNVLIGYWAGKVGQRNGRSFALCFCLGFFLGLIGVLVVYLIGPGYDSRPAPYGVAPPPGYGPPPDPHQQRTRVCGQCGKLVEGSARFCGYCGAQVAGPAPRR
ncbi:MAG: zinc ribbon domain-containing protein [Actinobacteria bacterium]|nr:zinc ribbon domain-containing protein [Actinomycetota bacterium]